MSPEVYLLRLLFCWRYLCWQISLRATGATFIGALLPECFSVRREYSLPLLTGLMSWYTERRAKGVAPDPHMEAFVAADAEVRSGRVKLDFG